jgi:hypothetical protein
MAMMQLPAFQPPQLESPGNMMARMAQMQAMQDASEEKQLALEQRKRLLGEQGELNALISKEGGLTQNVLTRMATMLDPKAREMGFAGLQDIADREVYRTAGQPKPNQFTPEPAPAQPSLLNRLMPQAQTSTPLPTGAPAPVSNVLGRSRSFGDPVLEELYNQRDVEVARLQMARGNSKYAERSKEIIASIDRQIGDRQKFYAPATVAAGGTQRNALTGDFRAPTQAEQFLMASGLNPDSEEFKEAMRQRSHKDRTHAPTVIQDQFGNAYEVIPSTGKGPSVASPVMMAGKDGPQLPTKPLGAPSATVQKEQENAEKIPGAIGEMKNTVKLVRELLAHPGFSSTVGATLRPGFRLIPGTKEADFVSRSEQLEGEAFLLAFETLRGAGAISEAEGLKATKAKNRMKIATSEKEYQKAAAEFIGVIERAVKNAEGRYSKVQAGKRGPGAVSSPAPEQPSGDWTVVE